MTTGITIRDHVDHYDRRYIMELWTDDQMAEVEELVAGLTVLLERAQNDVKVYTMFVAVLKSLGTVFLDMAFKETEGGKMYIAVLETMVNTQFADMMKATTGNNLPLDGEWLICKCAEYEEHNVSMETLVISNGISEWFSSECSWCRYETTNGLKIVNVERELDISEQLTGRVRIIFPPPTNNPPQ